MLTWKIVRASKVSVLFNLNIMLTWKIVGASKVSVLYIYIYRLLNESWTIYSRVGFLSNREVSRIHIEFLFCFGFFVLFWFWFFFFLVLEKGRKEAWKLISVNAANHILSFLCLWACQLMDNWLSWLLRMNWVIITCYRSIMTHSFYIL